MGFFPHLKRNHIIINSLKSTVLQTYYRLASSVVGLNVLLSLVNLGVYKLLSWPLALFIIVSTIYFISVSLMGSYLKYIEIKGVGFVQFKQNTSFIVGFIMMVPIIGLCFFPMGSPYLYIGLGGLLLVACLIFACFYRHYEAILLPAITTKLFN